ncbi:MAG: chitobiase/beta-hexosaminidase C-terminal domain-containing protein, partial [Terracidiphilus sp.]
PPGIPALSNVPYLYSFCFENGTSRSLVLINTDLSNSHTVSFAGTNPPQGAVTERQYAPSSPDDMNEAPTGSASNLAPATVSLSTSSLSTPGSITLPPYSVTALDYTASGTATAALPTFTPAAGTYAASQTVTIGDATSGATIYYTTNGTTPTTSSTKYSGTITVGASAALQAIAVKTGFTNSPVATAIYTIGTVLPAPTFSLAAGNYITVQSVTISDATAGTTIYYTTNGTTPTSSSTKYSGAITVSASETLEAIAIKTGFTNSSVATAPYTISTVLPAPAFSPAAGTYTASQSVTISDAASGTTIYYTTNGTTPTASSTKYSGTITVSASETLEAIAVKTGFNNSSTTSGAYVISPSLSATGSAGSTSYISYSSGAFTATDLALNSGASITSGMLRLTDGGLNESRTAWFAKQVPIQNFITDFTFQQLNALADGMTFAIQGHGISAKGFSGAGLGYQNIWGSVAVKFDLFSNAGEGPDSTGLYTNGTVPTVPAVNLSTTGINLHSGDVMHAHLVYNGTNLTMTLTDTVTKATVTEVFPVNIPSFVGGNTAYVGFTGGTGSQSATQDVLSWSFESTVGPSVAEPTFSPAGGAYASAQTVLISDATAGTTIYYTTNGAAPTTSSSVYSSAITVSATETLEAIAVKTGYTTSPVSTGAYTITGSGTSSVAEDFTITPSGTTATVARGGLVAYALTVAPLSPATTFPTAIKLSANGLPSGATYSFSPAAVAEGAGATAVTLMVQLPQVASAKQPAGGIGSLFAPRMGPIALGLLLLPFSGGLRRAGKRMGRAIPMVLLLVMAMSVVIGLGGCGTTNTLISSTQRSYAVAVIGTAGSISRSTTVTLIVMQ